jgi:hypothetical protein
MTSANRKKLKLRNIQTGEVVEKEISYEELIYNQDILGRIIIDGVEYQRLRYLEEKPKPKKAQYRPVQPKYPYFSDAMGVHPCQIQEAKEKLAKLGVRVEYTPDGRAIIESPQHRKQLAEAMGLHDRNSYGTRHEARYKPYRNF